VQCECVVESARSVSVVVDAANVGGIMVARVGGLLALDVETASILAAYRAINGYSSEFWRHRSRAWIRPSPCISHEKEDNS
jgi:hypothetical protein